jgi:hypothetical protein
VTLTILGAALLLALLLASSIWKTRRSGVIGVAVNTGVFYFYYLGRAIALLDPRMGKGVAGSLS